MPDAPSPAGMNPAARFKTLSEQLQGVYSRFLALNQRQKAKVIAGGAAFCYFCFIMVCIVYSMTGVKKAVLAQRNVLVYMDAMPSDFAALRYLIKRSDVHVTGIIVNISGFGLDVRMATDNVLRFLRLMTNEGSKYAASIPVYYGDHVASFNANFDAKYFLGGPTSSVVMPNTTSSCTYNRVIAPEVNGGLYSADLLFGAAPSLLSQVGIPFGPTAPIPQYAQPQLIANMLLQQPSTLLSFAAMTDVAALFNLLGPKLSSAITDVFVAGGAVSVQGDVQAIYRLNTAAELNVFFDPMAAQQVLQLSTRAAYVVTSDAARALSFPQSVWNTLVTSRTASTNPSSAGVVATGLNSQWGALSYSSDSRAPMELIAAALFAEPAILSASIASLSYVNVIAGVSLSLDGTLSLASSGTGGPKTVIIGNNDPVFFWNNVLAVDRLPYPVQN